jgi:hypothetical protein
VAQPELRIPEPDADRPRVGGVALAALVPFVLGVFLVRATLDRQDAPASDEPVASPDPSREDAPDEYPSVQPAGPDHPPDDLGAEIEQADDAQDTQDAQDAPAQDEATMDGPAPLPRRVGLGRVAYLACEGVPPQSGPFPCPRDRDLEARVWATLEALPECPTMPTEVGPGDLRLTFTRGAPVEITARDRGPESLSHDALIACLEEPLADLTTSIRADELLVSFHFALIARP